MVISQGDVFQVDFEQPVGSAAGFRRPAVVIQSDLLNRTDIRTVIVCPLTSNLGHAERPGNVRIGKGEANLSKPSVAVVPLVRPIDKSQLAEKCGTLSKVRLQQIIAGVLLVIEPPV